MDINKVTLIGRLVRKPELETNEAGVPIARFSIATNYIWRDYKTKEKHDTTQFHTVMVWGKLAEIASTYLDKASRVYIEGRLQYREITDADNRKRVVTDIIADELIMLGKNGTKKEEIQPLKTDINPKELTAKE